jgi:hypothetical protein
VPDRSHRGFATGSLRDPVLFDIGLAVMDFGGGSCMRGAFSRREAKDHAGEEEFALAGDEIEAPNGVEG